MAFKNDTLRYRDTVQRPLVAGTTVSEEGLLLKSVLVAGSEHLTLTAGTANEKVVGFAYNTNLSVTTAVVVEDTLVIPGAAPYTIQLKKANLVAGSVRVHNVAANSDFAVGSGAGEYSIDLVHGTLTFDAADKDKAIVVTYKYNLTMKESALLYRERPVNAPNAAFFDEVVAIVGSGELYTTAFDSSLSYDAVNAVYAGANGIITAASGGVALPARVISTPTAASPYLGLAFNFAA